MKIQHWKNLRYLLLAVGLVIFLIGLGPSVPAARPVQASAPLYEITLWTVGAGGGSMERGAYQLAGTAGQTEAAQPLAAGGYTLSGGFWPAAFPIWQAYLPSAQR